VRKECGSSGATPICAEIVHFRPSATSHLKWSMEQRNGDMYHITCLGTCEDREFRKLGFICLLVRCMTCMPSTSSMSSILASGVPAHPASINSPMWPCGRHSTISNPICTTEPRDAGTTRPQPRSSTRTRSRSTRIPTSQLSVQYTGLYLRYMPTPRYRGRHGTTSPSVARRRPTSDLEQLTELSSSTRPSPRGRHGAHMKARWRHAERGGRR